MLRILRASEARKVLAPERRRIPVPVRRAQRARAAVPRSATNPFVPTRWRSSRISRRAGSIIVMVIPVTDPFPDIPCHVIEPIGTLALFEGSHWRQGSMIVRPCLPIICVTGCRWLVAPRIEAAIRPARRLFPLRLCRQTLAGPFTVRRRIRPIHIRNRPLLMRKLVHGLPI